MSINIYKDQMQYAELFGKPVLYTARNIPRETVPEGWYCYDLRGNERHPHAPCVLEDVISYERLSSVLSPVPLKRASTRQRQIKDSLFLTGEMTDLSAFCQKHDRPCPSDPRKYILRPASKEEAGFFYSQMEPEQDETHGTVGHLRIDFGSGESFCHSWWPHNDDRFNTPEFKAILQEFVDEMRALGPLKDQKTMAGWCYRNADSQIAERHYGFVTETADYRFCLRCVAERDDYAYLYCYDLNQQKLAAAQEKGPRGPTERGLQKMRDAANPNLSHSYDWYVMESCNTPGEQYTEGLSLEEAIRRYTASEHEDKRLGVTKDDISTPPQSSEAIAEGEEEQGSGRSFGRQAETEHSGLCDDDDPVVAEAVPRLQQMLESAPIVGRITFINGDSKEFTDAEQYLQAIREELPYYSATGFQYETLTNAPAVRKAVDDIVYDLCAEENPHTLADYGGTGMAMGYEPVREMSKDNFWELICEARTLCGQDMDAYASWLREQLMEAGPQQAQDFHDFVHAYRDLAYQYGLWSAASIICGGCTDDGFIDFRAWLIAQGWNVYRTALNDPDSLADVEPHGGYQFEDLTYIGSAVLEELTGQDAYENMDSSAYNKLVVELERDVVYGEGLGYPYEPNEIADRFPRLCAKYLPPQDLSAMMERGSTWNPGIREIQAARAAGPKNAVILRPWAGAATQAETPKSLPKRDVEQAIAAMKAETFREIQKDRISPEARLAWYWSYIGSLDMAQELGLITETRRQALCREAESYKPDCVVAGKNLEQQTEEGGMRLG